MAGQLVTRIPGFDALYADSSATIPAGILTCDRCGKPPRAGRHLVRDLCDACYARLRRGESPPGEMVQIKVKGRWSNGRWYEPHLRWVKAPRVPPGPLPPVVRVKVTLPCRHFAECHADAEWTGLCRPHYYREYEKRPEVQAYRRAQGAARRARTAARRAQAAT